MSELDKVREYRLTVWQRVRNWARALKRDLFALYYSIGHPLVPWYAKAIAMVVVGYALSPIDLIPDFVPVFGYLDDVILIPLGIALVIRLMPPDLLEQCRREAADKPLTIKPKSWVAAFLIVVLWFLTAFGLYKVFQ